MGGRAAGNNSRDVCTHVRTYVRTYLRTYVLTQVLTHLRTSSKWAQTHSTKKHTYVRTNVHAYERHTYERTYVREVHRSPPLRLPISRLSMRTAVCFCEPPFWIPVRLAVPERNVAHMPDLDGEKQPVGKVGVAVGAIVPPTMFKRQPFPHVRYVRNYGHI